MGYTHYWRNVKRGPFPPEFLRATRAVIAQTYDLKLRDVSVTSRCVTFDGTYETFCFEPGEKFAFCKTAAQPYDVVVVAVLALAAHFALADVSSDGTPTDWRDGIALARSASGIEVAVPAGVVRPDVATSKTEITRVYSEEELRAAVRAAYVDAARIVMEGRGKDHDAWRREIAGLATRIVWRGEGSGVPGQAALPDERLRAHANDLPVPTTLDEVRALGVERKEG